VLRCVVLTSDNPESADPRFGAWGKQKCEDTDPLTRERMETVEEDLLQVSLDFMDKSAKSGKPFFLWHNTTRMHVWTRLSPKWEKKNGYGLYADGICCIKCQSVGIEQAPEICYLTIFNDDNNNDEPPAC
jgi:hypothetical protein